MLIFQIHGQGTGCFFPGHYLRLASGIATVFSRTSTFARCSRRTPAIPHPYAASVRILSTRFEKDNGSLPADFNGYSAFTVPSQEFDGDHKPVGQNGLAANTSPSMKRASQEQRSPSLNFQLHA
jgi:hypothetical protein